ncbi:MAG: phosphoribosyltransferase [Spirochaetales bacterium]|nr:phosphoribosyltransferase [Spirochaetales bacterium]
MKREYISYSTVRDNSFKLAYRIFNSGFTPDVIYVCLRGGVYIGNIISEFFKIIRKGSAPLFYAAVVARSYFTSEERYNVVVDGWTYNPGYLRKGEKILFVDDIFDSGCTMNHLVNCVINQGIAREDIRVAVHNYKIRPYLEKQHTVIPDFSAQSHIIERPEDDIWIHYLSHEIIGLTRKNLFDFFPTADEEVKRALSVIKEFL